ncbi:MAG: SGNH/GDSL hydrolase family protein [Lachnospiraceae bacterium]|nr:SGNH/GDSL hydrolase family protein [Lachnospiraceae bacterium]
MGDTKKESKKNVVFLGSSVTYGAASGGVSFADFVSERNGWNMIKEAVSGTTLADKDDESYVSRLKKIEVDKVDLFICQLSTNDASQNIPLNDVRDAINFIISFVREKWNCPIAFYTNPKYDSKEYEAMVDLMKEITEKENLILINMWDDNELNSAIDADRARFMADPIHPTKDGYLEIMTPFVEKYNLI